MSSFLTHSTLLRLFAASALYLSPKGVEAAVVRRTATDSSTYTCSDAIIPITASAQNTRFDAHAPGNQLDVAAAVSELIAINSNYTASITDKTNSTQKVSGTWKIYTKACIPTSSKWNGNVQILTHGIAATHAYFEYASNKSISFIDVAASEGNAVVSYDRLGVGKSDHPDGLHVVQAALDLEILHQLVTRLKKDSRFTKATQWIGVGHSYGSELTAALLAKYPSDVSKAILTGFSPTTTKYAAATLNAFSPTIASDQDSSFSRYKNDTSYWVTESPSHDLAGFFDGPPGVHYSEKVFDNFVATKGAFTYGQFLSMGVLSNALPAQQYNGDILIVTGAHDAPECGGNCYSGNNGASVLTGATTLFPQAKSLATYIPPNTAHAAFQHYTAPAVFGTINSWLQGTYH